MTDSKDDSMSNLLLTHLENPHKVNDIPEKAEPVMGDNTSAKPTLKNNLTETTEREDMGPIKLPSLQNKTEQRNDPPAIPVVQTPQRPTPPPPPPKTEVPKPSKKDNIVSDTSSVKSRSKKFKKPSMSKSEIHQKKVDLLYKFADLRNKGIKMSKQYTLDSDLDDMEYEFEKLNRQKKIQNSVVLQQNLLISGISFIEMMNDKYDPFGLRLKGWSENVHDNIDQFNGVFEELYNKYKTSIEAPPEVKLVGMLAGSACMYHLSQSLSDNIQNLSAMNMQAQAAQAAQAQAQAQAAAAQAARAAPPPSPPQENLQDLLSNLGKMQGNNQSIPSFNVDTDSEKDSNEGDGEINFS